MTNAMQMMITFNIFEINLKTVRFMFSLDLLSFLNRKESTETKLIKAQLSKTMTAILSDFNPKAVILSLTFINWVAMNTPKKAKNIRSGSLIESEMLFANDSFFFIIFDMTEVIMFVNFPLNEKKTKNIAKEEAIRINNSFSVIKLLMVSNISTTLSLLLVL